MSKLSNKIKESGDKLEQAKMIASDLISAIKFENGNHNSEIVFQSRKLMETLGIEVDNPSLHKLNRSALYEEAKEKLPSAIFEKIDTIIHQSIVKSVFDDALSFEYFFDYHLKKVKYDLQMGPFSIKAVEWGLVSKIIFDPMDPTKYWEFPAMIKQMIYQVPEEFRRTPLEFKIVSTLGWMEKEKFYQPYQIWTLERYKFSQEQDSQISMEEQTDEETFLWS